jgi:hypothetical protein
MTIIPYILVYHVKQLVLSIFYMHTITNLIVSLSCLIAHFLQIVEFIMQLKIYFMRVVKCMFGIQNSRVMQEKELLLLCEFVLT